MNLISTAYAMGQNGSGAQNGTASGFASFIPLILMFVIFYFLLIRPQQKKNKEQRHMIENLKVGDKIITNGGIHCRITNVSNDDIIVEIADKVKIKLNRNSVATIIKTSPQVSTSEKQEKTKEKIIK